MTSTERRLQLFDIIKREKVIQVVDMAQWFQVSNMTIRRDLAVLEKQGVVTTHYGGATLNEGSSVEPSLQMKSRHSQVSKDHIAYEASFLINDGDSIYVDCGSTTLELVKYIANKKITMITNSWKVLSEIKDFNKVKVIMACGEFDPISEGVLSSSTIRFLGNYKIDKAFVSTQGIDEEGNLMVPMDFDAEVKKTGFLCAKQRILLVDHTKFGQSFFAKHGHVKDFDAVITDDEVDDVWFERLKQMNANCSKAYSYRGMSRK